MKGKRVHHADYAADFLQGCLPVPLVASVCSQRRYVNKQEMVCCAPILAKVLRRTCRPHARSMEKAIELCRSLKSAEGSDTWPTASLQAYIVLKAVSRVRGKLSCITWSCMQACLCRCEWMDVGCYIYIYIYMIFRLAF